MIASEPSSEQLPFKRYAQIVGEHRHLFFTAAALSVAFLVFWVYRQGPQYVAECDVVVQKFHAVGKTTDRAGFEEQGVALKTRVLKITGDEVLNAVVNKLNLKEAFQAASEEEARRLLEKQILVSEKELKSDVIAITVHSGNPEQAVKIANTIGDTYVDQDTENILFLADKMEEDEAKPAVDRLSADLKTLKARRLELEHRLRRYSKDDQGGDAGALNYLKEDLRETTQQIQETTQEFLERIRRGDHEGAVPPNVRILNYARTPLKPTYGKSLKLGLVGIVFLQAGLFLFLVVKDAIHKKIKNAEDLGRVLFLGYVPRDPHIPEVGNLPPSVKEAFRLARTTVLFSLPAGREKSLLVTSARSSEGKSAVAANLAVAMAKTGTRTLLAEINLRNPGLALRFKPAVSPPGLVDYLNGHARLEEIIKPTTVDHLDILLAGSPTPDSSDLLSPDSLRSLIAGLAPRYDKIIIDSPPVLGIPDGLLVSKCVDGVILVVRQNMTEIALFEKAVEQLRGAEATIVGALINFSDPKGQGDTHRYYAEANSGLARAGGR